MKEKKDGGGGERKEKETGELKGEEGGNKM
jgi:hypothetical protein